MAEGKEPGSFLSSAQPAALGYFFYFWVMGVFTPHLGPALLAVGFSKQETGLIMAATYGFNVLFPILGGRITDRFLSITVLIKLGALAMALSAIGLWWFSGPVGAAFLLCLLCFSGARAPMSSLQDTLTLQLVKDRPDAFSRIRMAGSLGFAAATVVMGYATERAGVRVFFAILTLSSFAFCLHSLLLPQQPTPNREHVETSFWRGLGWPWWLWVAAMFMHWVALGPYHYGYTLLLKEQGVTDQAGGWYWVLGILAEILMFLTSGWFFARWKLKTLMLLALIANLARWAWIGFFPGAWVLAASQLLHAFGFGLYYAVAMATLTQFSGGRHRASYQGLFATCVGGIGSIVGSILAGSLHQLMPLDQVIAWCVPVQILAVLLMLGVPYDNLMRKNEHFVPT